MLIIRCANGVVTWVFSPSGRLNAVATCTQDGFTITLSRIAVAGWNAAFQALFVHTIALKGAVQETLFVPSPIIG